MLHRVASGTKLLSRPRFRWVVVFMVRLRTIEFYAWLPSPPMQALLKGKAEMASFGKSDFGFDGRLAPAKATGNHAAVCYIALHLRPLAAQGCQVQGRAPPGSRRWNLGSASGFCLKEKPNWVRLVNPILGSTPDVRLQRGPESRCSTLLPLQRRSAGKRGELVECFCLKLSSS